MPNDPAQDGHIKTNNNMHEYDEVVFEDLSEQEIFWKSPGKGTAYRKLDMVGNVQDTQTREESVLKPKTKVYVRN